MGRKAKSKKEKIVYLLNNHVPVSEIAKALKVSPSYVYTIRAKAQPAVEDAGLFTLTKPAEQVELAGIPTLTESTVITFEPVKKSWWQKLVAWFKGA